MEHSLSSVQFSHSVVSDSFRPHKPQHARPPCPSPTPGVHPNPRPLSRWCHPIISSSVVPQFSSCPQSFPTSGSFPMSQLFTSDGQRIRRRIQQVYIGPSSCMPGRWASVTTLSKDDSALALLLYRFKPYVALEWVPLSVPCLGPGQLWMCHPALVSVSLQGCESLWFNYKNFESEKPSLESQPSWLSLYYLI